MIDRTTKLRVRRRLRRSQKQIEGIGSVTEENLERHFFRRLGRLYGVRRFLIAWILLVVLLIGGVVVQVRALSHYYQVSAAAPGGIYSEGIIGSFTDANPLYATSDVDTTVAHLIFSGLLKFDENNQLAGDLATDWSVDATGKLYTVNLRQDVKWHDGQSLNAADVVFTYKTIQNPDALSPLFGNWQGVTVTAPSDYTVTFKLPTVLASFPYTLTNGIVPRHILRGVPVSSLRSVPFNTTQPIGSGPFKWETVEVSGDKVEDREQRIGLLPNEHYYAGKPKLNEFIVRTFLDEKHLETSFHDNQLTAIAGDDNVSSQILMSRDNNVMNIPMTSAVMIFLRMSSGIMSDQRIRQALLQGTDRLAIIKNLQYPSLVVDEPFLRGQLGYDPAQRQLPYELTAANALLDAAGWTRGSDGMRAKGGQPLEVSIYALSTPEFASVIEQLQKQWAALGVKLTPNQLNGPDLQGVIKSSAYDSLLYGISIGNDPDVFAYWDSQANTLLQKRLNFSDYSSKQADLSLEAGRTRLDPVLRSVKYNPFLQAWRADVPAIALYQPRYLYVTKGKVFNFNPHKLNNPVDRFSNVQNWEIRVEKQTQ